jgi:hypothetical protein
MIKKVALAAAVALSLAHASVATAASDPNSVLQNCFTVLYQSQLKIWSKIAAATLESRTHPHAGSRSNEEPAETRRPFAGQGKAGIWATASGQRTDRERVQARIREIEDMRLASATASADWPTPEDAGPGFFIDFENNEFAEFTRSLDNGQ